MRWILPLLLLLSACVLAGPTLPDRFRTGRDPRYPSDRYLVAVGDGPHLEAARQRAVAAIAAQVRSSLRATDLLFASASSSGASEEHLSQDIRLESRFDRPEWVRVVDAAVEGNRVHVLAVLDRLEAAARLEAEIAAQRTALRARLDQAGEGATLRERTLAVAEAQAILRGQLLPLDAELAAFRGSAAPPPPEVEAVLRARQELEAVRREQVLRVCVEPAIPDRLGSDLAMHFGAILSGLGVPVASCAAEGDGWLLQGRLVASTAAPSRQPGAWRRFCTTRLDYRISTSADGALVGGGSAGGARNQAGGNDYHEACQTSATELARSLAVDLGFLDPPRR